LGPRDKIKIATDQCLIYIILRSIKDLKLYVGTCLGEPEDRLKIHNEGGVKSTKYRKPFEIVYAEFFETLPGARKKEWMLKYTPWGGKLKKKLAIAKT